MNLLKPCSYILDSQLQGDEFRAEAHLTLMLEDGNILLKNYYRKGKSTESSFLFLFLLLKQCVVFFIDYRNEIPQSR